MVDNSKRKYKPGGDYSRAQDDFLCALADAERHNWSIGERFLPAYFDSSVAVDSWNFNGWPWEQFYKFRYQHARIIQELDAIPLVEALLVAQRDILLLFTSGRA